MKFFDSIATEIVVVPLALLLGSGIATALFDSTMHRSTAGMLAAEQEQANVRETLGAIETIAERARGEGLLYLAQIGSGLEDAKLEVIKTRAEKGLDEAVVQVKRLSEGAGKLDWMAAANNGPAVLGQIKAYREALDELNQMASIDRMIGIPMVGNVEDKFARLHEGLVGWRTVVNQAAEAHRDEIAAAAARARVSILGGAAAAMAVLLGVCLLIVRKLVRSIKGMCNRMSALSQGDTESPIPGAGRRDEIGEMAAAVEIFRENAIEVDRMREAQERQRRQAEQDKRQAMNQLADAFDASVRNIVSSVSSSARQLQRNAQSMSANADQTTGQCTTVAAAAEEASVNVQTVASATEELTCSINEISRQVSESSRIGSLAVEEANRANATVNGLTEAAQRIGEVVQLKTVTATTADAIKTITGTIRQMSEISTTIASAVEEQGAATREIARNVSEASRGTQDVSSNIVCVSKAASETGSAATETLSAANDLGAQSETLAREVERFISKVRQA